MRFLLDANLSPRLVTDLTAVGHAARHVADVGLLAAEDSAIFQYAAAEGDVVITADSDFSALLATRGEARPSVVLLRHVGELTADVHAALLIANLPSVLAELDEGAVVSLSPSRLAVRHLPIG